MTEQIKDFMDNEVNVGDTVAGAFRVGNRAELRVGTVEGGGSRAGKGTLKVTWHSVGGVPVNIQGAIEVGLNRFIKLNN